MISEGLARLERTRREMTSYMYNVKPHNRKFYPYTKITLSGYLLQQQGCPSYEK